MALAGGKTVKRKKRVQLSNLESFIKKTLGGSGEGLKIETLANTIVNKFYDSHLFSDTALQKDKEEPKWKVGMQVLILSKSKDRWIRGFIKVLGSEGYVTVAYADRVKTVHPDSESLRPAICIEKVKRRSNEEVKLEFDQTSPQNWSPCVDMDDLYIDDQSSNLDLAYDEIMRVIEKNLEPPEPIESDSDRSITLTVSSPHLNSSRSPKGVKSTTCPTQMRDEIVTKLKKITKQRVVTDDKRLKISKLASSIATLENGQKTQEVKVKKTSKELYEDGDSLAEVEVQRDHRSPGDGITLSVKHFNFSGSLNVISLDDAKHPRDDAAEEKERNIENPNSSYMNSEERSSKELLPRLTIENYSSSFGLMSQQSYVAKVLVVGDNNSGKTSVIRRYVSKTFSASQNVTVGIDYATKYVEVGSQKLQLVFWDIAGQDRFIGLAPTYYRNAAAAIIVFDATENFRKLDNTAKWKFEVDSKVFYPNDDPIPVVLLANKWDLIEAGEKSQIISNDILDIYCRKHSFAGWFPTSAKTGLNIPKGMDFLVSLIIKNKHKQTPLSSPKAKEGSLNLTSSNTTLVSGGGCCG